MYELLNKNKDIKGNRLSNCPKSFPSQTIVHAKLEMTNPGDADEQEADAVANDITNGNVIKRQISSGNNNSGITLPHNMESVLNAMQGGGQEMPQGLQSMMEHGFNHDFSNVRIHTDASASEMSGNIHAKAFTHGNDIYFNQGQFNPGTQEGQRLVAHELTHVVQNSNKVARNAMDTAYELDSSYHDTIVGLFLDVLSDIDSVLSLIFTLKDLKEVNMTLRGNKFWASATGKINQLKKLKGDLKLPEHPIFDKIDTVATIYCLIDEIICIYHDIDMLVKGNKEYAWELGLNVAKFVSDLSTYPKIESFLITKCPGFVFVCESFSAGVYLGDLINKTTGADKYMADVVFPFYNELLLKHDIHWLDFSGN